MKKAFGSIALLPFFLACVSETSSSDIGASGGASADVLAETGGESGQSTASGGQSTGGQSSAEQPTDGTSSGGQGSETETPPDEPICDGVLNGSGEVCCAASCGTCGGSGCGTRPGGVEACCTGVILDSGQSCDSNSAPCVMGEVPTSEPPDDVPSWARLVLDVSFDARSGSFQNYTLANARDDFGAIEARSSGEIRGFDGDGKTWPADNRAGNGVLRANYPANIAGGTNSGFLFDKRFEGTEEAIFEYRLKFNGAGADDEFVWAAGGKLPGLGGTNKDRGIPVGCTKNESNIENGFSARLMWRRHGNLVAYTYLPERTTNCGEDFTFLEGTQPDRWYTVRQHIRLNTPGNADGLLDMYVDGERTLHMTDVLYRLSGKDDVKIDDVLFHTYRGGEPDDDRFWSPNDDHVEFDDFRVWIR